MESGSGFTTELVFGPIGGTTVILNFCTRLKVALPSEVR